MSAIPVLDNVFVGVRSVAGFESGARPGFRRHCPERQTVHNQHAPNKPSVGVVSDGDNPPPQLTHPNTLSGVQHINNSVKSVRIHGICLELQELTTPCNKWGRKVVATCKNSGVYLRYRDVHRSAFKLNLRNTTSSPSSRTMESTCCRRTPYHEYMQSIQRCTFA